MLLDVTRSGYGNTYYAEAAFAASHNWSALLTNAADLSDYVSLDKGPLPDWLMGLSGRLLGFGSFSVMVPNALYAIATVIVLYDAVRRALGRQIAILAALMMALTPVRRARRSLQRPGRAAAACCSYARPGVRPGDPVGACAESAAVCDVRGPGLQHEDARGVLVLPAFAIASWRGAARRADGSAGWRSRRLMLIVSLAWFSAMMLVPAASDPASGSTNSWFRLIFEGDGTQRLAGRPGAFREPFRTQHACYLFSAHVSGQIAWLLPLALVGLVLGLLTTVALAAARASRLPDVGRLGRSWAAWC